MRSFVCFSVLLAVPLLLTACAAPETETAAEVPVYDAATFYQTTTLRGVSFSADESRLLLTSDQTGTFNAYSVPWQGGELEQLTDSTTDAVFSVAWFPEDDRFLYTADQGGNELNHLYVKELDGSVTDLTPGEKLKASFVRFSTDREHFWVGSNERDPQFFDLYRYRTRDYARERVFENRDGYMLGDVSRDGRWVALVKRHSNANSDLYLWSLESGERRHLTPHDGDISYNVVSFTPDGGELYYSTDGEGEFTQVWSYAIDDREHHPAVTADWDVLYVSFSDAGRYMVSAVNDDASTRVTVRERATGSEVELPKLPAGDLRSVTFSPSETRVALYVNSDTSPSNLFAFELGAGEAQQLTRALSPAIAETDLVEGKVVRYASFDGLEIPSILYRPHGAGGERPAPALVWVHGGPGGQSRKGYRAEIQHLVNHGYAVLAVNNRGSSGYGKTFWHMDDRRHGDVDLKDCVAARGYLESLDWIDGSRIGIIGGSYGGYMVAAALAFEPEVFDVGIDIFGVTNWVRTLESIPPWWVANRDSLYSELGDPATDQERLRRISPLFHAANIARPLLVVQGANDPRVLQVESDELVEAVRANGVPVEYLVFEDEGHGFRRKSNRIAASEAYVTFLEEHLRGGSSPS